MIQDRLIWGCQYLLFIGSENTRHQHALLSDLRTALSPFFSWKWLWWGGELCFKPIHFVDEHCTGNLALRVTASSPLVISAVNTLTLVFVLHVPVEPGNNGAVENGTDFEASYLCLV